MSFADKDKPIRNAIYWMAAGPVVALVIIGLILGAYVAIADAQTAVRHGKFDNPSTLTGSFLTALDRSLNGKDRLPAYWQGVCHFKNVISGIPPQEAVCVFRGLDKPHLAYPALLGECVAVEGLNGKVCFVWASGGFARAYQVILSQGVDAWSGQWDHQLSAGYPPEQAPLPLI